MTRHAEARSLRPLMAGWRAYRLDEPVTLAAARGLLDDVAAAGAVQLDVRMHPVAITNDPQVGGQWALPQIAAPAGWTRAAGAAPVTVAVIDTGVDVSHPDLASRVWHNPREIAGNGVDDRRRRRPGRRRHRVGLLRRGREPSTTPATRTATARPTSQEHAHQRHRPLTAHPTRQPMSRVVPCRITYTGRARRGWNTMEASSPSLRASSCGRRRKLTELTSPSSSRNSPS